MTIIVVKDGVVAWDSLITQGPMKWGTAPGKMVKIVKRKKNYIVGGAGDLHEIQQWKRTIMDMDDDEFGDWLACPILDRHTKSSPILFDPVRRLMYEGIDKTFTILSLRGGINYATGIGEQYAYGLMDAGKDAYTTVAMVCRKFDCCGPPICHIDTTRLKHGV